MNTNTFAPIDTRTFRAVSEKCDGVPPHDSASTITEINRLHAEAQRLEHDSRNALDSALAAAWQAGKLLISEKAHIRQRAGRGAWLSCSACYRPLANSLGELFTISTCSEVFPTLKA